MQIIVIGAGQVGSTVVAALHDEHDVTVVDLDEARLRRLSTLYDVSIREGNGASRRTLEEVGIREADLLIACTSRDESNIIASMFCRSLSPDTKTIVRTTNDEYLEVWRERQLEVTFMVSSEHETALAVSRIIGFPAARQTDVFADGQVQIVEFDVETLSDPEVIGLPLREARIPADSKVASIIRGDEALVPRGTESIQPGDRIVVIGSPQAAREWSAILAPGESSPDEVVVFGAGRIGTAVARVLLSQKIHVRVVEASAERAQQVGAELEGARVHHATGLDPDFLQEERIGQASAGVFAMRDDAKNHYAATLAKLYGVPTTIAIVHDAVSARVFERAGIDVSIDPRSITAEEIVRWAHDPRTQQVAMLEGDRYEVLDVRVRPESRLVHIPFRELPMTGSLVGAIVREGKALFPHGDDVLLPEDRAIVFTRAARAAEVERTL